jgi:hypothetical protein
MPQHIRRALAALGLMAALLLMVPSPSRAAGLWEVPALTPVIAVRVWIWLEGWLPGPRKTNGAKQGSGLDPNGSSLPATSSDPGTASNQGSGLDPNGSSESGRTW